MSSSWAMAFVLVGFLFNVTGIYLTLTATINVWRAYGTGPVWPWISYNMRKIRSMIKRLTFWTRKRKDARIPVKPASAVASGSEIIINGIKRLNFNAAMSDDMRFKRLEEAVMGIYKELDESREDTKEEHDALRVSINDLEKQVSNESERLEAFSKEAVTDDIRLQLVGLIFIGSGVIFAALPTIWSYIWPYIYWVWSYFAALLTN